MTSTHFMNRKLTLDQLEADVEAYLGMSVRRKTVEDDWGTLSVETPTGLSLLEIAVGLRDGGWSVLSTSYDGGWDGLMRIHEEPVQVTYCQRDGEKVKVMRREMARWRRRCWVERRADMRIFLLFSLALDE